MSRWEAATIGKVVGVLGWGGTALVVLSVAVRFLAPERQGVWNGLAIAGLVTLLLYGLTQWRDIVALFAGRHARFGAVMVAGVVIVLGILTGINYIAARQNRRWDLTAARQFALADQSRKMLEGLAQPVSIKVFGREDDFAAFRERLDEFEYASSQVKTEYIDPDKNPSRAREYAIQTYGTAVLEYAGRTERVTSPSEQDLINGLIKVVEGQSKTLYFAQGHGEKDTGSSERDGYSGVKDALERENFSLEALVLIQQADIPSDASAVILAGPRTDLLAPEIEALQRYLERGGKLICLIDPPEAEHSTPLPGLEGLLTAWGIELGHDVVVDASGVGQLIGTDASVPVAASYPDHPINEGFNLLTAFPMARSVSAASSSDGPTAQSFIETSPRSWAESDIGALTSGQDVTLDPDQGDRSGPVSIGVALTKAATVTDPTPAIQPPDASGDTSEDAADAPEDDEAPPPETRVVVVGDSDFPSNYALGIQGNLDLFMNIVNWAAQQENLIAVRAREPEDRRITLTADQQARIFWLSIFIIPGLVLASGVYTWWERR